MLDELKNLTTEEINERTRNIDRISTMEMLELMNDEDQKVALAVRKVLPEIGKAVDCVYEALKSGGRLFYVGAGTSGRIGVLDASECPPTYGTKPEMVQALIAGGEKAVFMAVEGAEDDSVQGAADLKSRGLTSLDVVVGIAASGRTPYVAGALEYARNIGAAVIALSCNNDAVISKFADYKIEVIVGQEVVTGSTRLKAATAQKMVLNMITTGTMIKLGKVYQNLMVDLNASNVKLIERAKGIVSKITGASYEDAGKVLREANYAVKPAIIMIETGVSFSDAVRLLKAAEDSIHRAVTMIKGD